MTKTILLTWNGLNNNISKWLYVVVGMVFTSNGINSLTNTPLTNLRLTAGILLLISGPLMAILGFITSTRNRYAPRVEMDEDGILVRRDIFVATKQLAWNEIAEIEYKPFALEFQLKNRKNFLIVLPKNAMTVLEIKRSLREMAEAKSIAVKGG